MCENSRMGRVPIATIVAAALLVPAALAADLPTATGMAQRGTPNFGFDVTARGLGMACPSGRWRPGFYSITVRTFDPTSGLTASASLYRRETRRC